MGTRPDATHLSSTCQLPYDVCKSYEKRQQTNCVPHRLMVCSMVMYFGNLFGSKDEHWWNQMLNMI